ncbi:MAG: hypothetical protein OER04_02330 [Cyclobacteriaceae bacterium]|nr:hypothetical protein [Cyclobacteriaceae bacterium]
MKKLFYILTIVSFAIYSCDDFELADSDIALQDLPGYVAFNGSGESATIDDENVAEGDPDVSFNIEVPTGTLSDITVDFTFGGTAVFGTDFTVANSAAGGGSIVLPHNPNDVEDFDNVDLVITILTDGVADGDKTLTITLAGATGDDGTVFAVGRGGTDFLKSANVNISDID